MQQPPSSSAPRRFIIDTDTGADDASALILAATSSDIKIEGVTVLAGNVGLDQAARNALMALETAGCDAPVYKGSADTYAGDERKTFSVFGTDGMGDANLINPSGTAENKDAIDFIIDTVRENPDEIEIVMLGPATNIAKAIERDPKTMSHVKMIWSMGTAGLGPGNASPVAEFNTFKDALAYEVFLDSDVPTTIVGLDVCGGDAQWTDAQFEELEQVNEVGQFVSASFSKLREYYKQNGLEGIVNNCDTLAMMCVLSPDFVIETTQCHASCIAEEGEAYGQVIFYQEGLTYDGTVDELTYDTTLVTSVDAGNYFNNYKEAISTIG